MSLPLRIISLTEKKNEIAHRYELAQRKRRAVLNSIESLERELRGALPYSSQYLRIKRELFKANNLLGHTRGRLVMLQADINRLNVQIEALKRLQRARA